MQLEKPVAERGEAKRVGNLQERFEERRAKQEAMIDRRMKDRELLSRLSRSTEGSQEILSALRDMQRDLKRKIEAGFEKGPHTREVGLREICAAGECPLKETVKILSKSIIFCQIKALCRLKHRYN